MKTAIVLLQNTARRLQADIAAAKKRLDEFGQISELVEMKSKLYENIKNTKSPTAIKSYVDEIEYFNQQISYRNNQEEKAKIKKLLSELEMQLEDFNQALKVLQKK
jgi:hypothetical protein